MHHLGSAIVVRRSKILRVMALTFATGLVGGGGGIANADLTPVEILLNGGFEQGVPATPWVESTLRGRELVDRSGPDGGPHNGNWQAKLGGSNSEHDLISQTVILPIGAASASLSFWYSIKWLFRLSSG